METNTKAVNKMRVDIATTLLHNTDPLENLCYHCGLEEADDQSWVGCDACHRWYHHGCVSSPPLDKDYLCPLCI